MSEQAYEVNFDGIVGPTHNYSGLSYGNVASVANQQTISNPKAAALQGLEKMHHLAQMGVKQAFLPPQERPHLPTMRKLGYRGNDQEILRQVWKESPELLMACCSSAAMWTANAATVTPSSDTEDHRLHLSAANLAHKFHRSIEAPVTAEVLRRIFSNPQYFVHHSPLPNGSYFSDEGAANHTRFCRAYGEKGLHLFVYGRESFKESQHHPKKFPARQTLEASQAIVRRHLVLPDHVIFAQQNPEAIDHGVFHNDVISVGNQNFFFYHEKAFLNTSQVIKQIQEQAAYLCGIEMRFLEVKEEEVSLKTAVDSYLFNSQIITLADKTVVLIAPSECHEIPSVRAFLDKMITASDNPVSQIHYFNLKESMRNGGGPACLRLRVALTQKEIQAVHPDIFFTEERYLKLKAWIEKNYRERLAPEDLADSHFLQETRQALHELTEILKLGSLYSFQQ